MRLCAFLTLARLVFLRYVIMKHNPLRQGSHNSNNFPSKYRADTAVHEASSARSTQEFFAAEEFQRKKRVCHHDEGHDDATQSNCGPRSDAIPVPLLIGGNPAQSSTGTSPAGPGDAGYSSTTDRRRNILTKLLRGVSNSTFRAGAPGTHERFSMVTSISV